MCAHFLAVRPRPQLCTVLGVAGRGGRGFFYRASSPSTPVAVGRGLLVLRRLSFLPLPCVGAAALLKKAVDGDFSAQSSTGPSLDR